jgi:TPP-dependent pyruvate/acetoin dehydrogenase alpha subunit
MSDQEQAKGKMDRRSFLKVMGSAGASAAIVSVGNPLSLGQQFRGAPPFGTNGSPKLGVNPGDLLASQPKEKLAEIYTNMNRSRKWETTMKDLFLKGDDGLYGAFHIYIGEEAIASGVAGALEKSDYIVSTHRGHGHLISKGGDLNKMSAEIFFREGGYNKGFGGSMHITDTSLGILGMNGIVGASWYIAAGAAYGSKIRGDNKVSVAFGGDGASNSPYYFSALRNAYNYKLPMVAIVENNNWQITIPQWSNVPGGESAAYTRGLPIPSVTVDGTDVAAVFAAAQEAVARARAGQGPSVIEAKAIRWYDHAGMAGAKVGQDGAFGLPYRSDSEVQQGLKNDPIARMKAFLLERGLFTEQELTQIETDTQKLVDESIEFARNSPPVKPEDGVLNVYAEGAVPPMQFLNGKATAWVPHPDMVTAGIHIPFEA